MNGNETNRTIPTKSQVEVVMSDWLGNLRAKEDRDYTHKGKGGIRRKTAGGTASYLVGQTTGMDVLDLMKTGRKASEQVVNAISPEPCVVQVGGGTSYHHRENDGRHTINIATDYFDDNALDKNDKVEIMLGLATHEAAHAAYTDNKVKMEMIEKEPNETKDLKKDIWNIIEDERIEYLLGEEYPGFSELLGTTKRYYFKKVINDMRTAGRMPTEPLPKLLAALTQAVRYPSQLTEEDVTDSFDELNAIRQALTPYPLTPEDTVKAAGRVMDVVKSVIKKDMQEKQQQQQQQQQQGTPGPQPGGQGGGQGGDQKQDPNGKPDQGAGGDPGNQKQEGQNGNQPDGGQSDGQGQQPQAPEPTEQQILDAIKDALGTQEAKKVINAIRKDEGKSDGRKESNSITGCSTSSEQRKDYVNQDDAEVLRGGSGRPRSFIFKPKGTPESYNRSLSMVRAFVPAMSKALACKSQESDYVLRGLPTGKLNTNKLVAFRTGNTCIFDKQGKVTCSSASVCILIDESGSMSTAKKECARAASILVNEAIMRIPNVNFYCYGYTSGKINVYSENGRTSRWALGATEATGGTPTGEAMEVAAQRIRKFTKEPVLMLVLSDGGADDENKVIEANGKLAKDRFITVGVGIQTNCISRSFKERVEVYDLSRFALDLGKLTRGKLDKMLVRTDSNQG